MPNKIFRSKFYEINSKTALENNSIKNEVLFLFDVLFDAA